MRIIQPITTVIENPDQSSNAPVADKQQRDALFAAGVRLLSMREHSLAELESKLSAKTDSADLVFAVLQELRSANFQSDSRFTENYVRSRANRGYGPIKIQKELRIKGIKTNMIDEYLDVNSAVWYENARKQYKKKYGDEPVSDYNTWTKRARFMQSRGFSSEHIQITLPPVQSD